MVVEKGDRRRMKLLQITRNAENQVASALKAKVERFMKSKKSESRLALLLDIRNLAQDLQEITCRKTDYDMLSKPEKVSPLPPKDRSPYEGMTKEQKDYAHSAQVRQMQNDGV